VTLMEGVVTTNVRNITAGYDLLLRMYSVSRMQGWNFTVCTVILTMSVRWIIRDQIHVRRPKNTLKSVSGWCYENVWDAWVLRKRLGNLGTEKRLGNVDTKKTFGKSGHR
jgi:hypothetical protein